MNNTINLTVELCAEDRARLDKLLEALTTRPIEKATRAVAEMAAAVAEVAPEPEKTPEPAPETPAEVTEDLPMGEPVEEITADDIQAFVRKLAAPETGKREACKAIIKKYADNVSSIPEDKCREVMNQLLDLAAEG